MSQNRGFSLIELLVSVFLIVMLTGLVSLGVGRGGSDIRLDSEVRYVASLLSFALREAELSSEDHGLFLGFTGDAPLFNYQGIWLRRYAQGWASPQGGAEAFQPLSFQQGFELSLYLEGLPEIKMPFYDIDLNPTPQIVMLAGGEMAPGMLQWLDPETRNVLYRLQWDSLGRMDITQPGDLRDMQ